MRPFARMPMADSWYGKVTEAVAKAHGWDPTVPLDQLPPAALEHLLYGAARRAGAASATTTTAATAATSATFEGLIPNLERRYRETDSEYVKSELETLHGRAALPGLRRQAAQAGGPGRDRRRPRTSRTCRPGRERGDGLGGHPPRAAHASASRPSPAQVLKEITRPAGLPGRRGPGLPDRRSHQQHPVGRRGPAHPPGDPDRLEPDGRAVHPRRAVHRPAPARQRQADRDPDPAARPGQHAPRRGARRGDHPHGRLDRGHRARRGRTRRRGRGPGHRSRRSWPSRARSPARSCGANGRCPSRQPPDRQRAVAAR